jgi:hypothetical protein
VGYAKGVLGHLFYSPSEHKVFVACKAVYLEKEFLANSQSGRNVELKEVQGPQIEHFENLEELKFLQHLLRLLLLSLEGRKELLILLIVT